MVNLASFWKPEACGQTVLPDSSVLIGQKLVESAKIQKFKWDILSNFQTMCVHGKLRLPCMEFDPAIRTFFLWFLCNPEFFDSFWKPGKMVKKTKCRKAIPNKG